MSEPAGSAAAKALREATLGFVWRQWKAVGATVTGSRDALTIVDPEALILMSLWMLPDERRLGDVTWSWVTLNSGLLSAQRLRNLREDFPAEVGRRLTALAKELSNGGKNTQWKSLATGKAEPLGERSEKSRAIAPRLTSWATLMLQLRLGMGVGVKADVLSFVLGMNPNAPEWASVAMIADGLGYTPAAVRRVADDLARARFIVTLDTGESEQATQRMFRGHPQAWAGLLHLSVNQFGWGFWPERYRFVIEVLTWLERGGAKPSSAYAQDVGAREILSRHGGALRKQRMVDPVEFASAELNLAYLIQTTTTFATWLGNNG